MVCAACNSPSQSSLRVKMVRLYTPRDALHVVHCSPPYSHAPSIAKKRKSRAKSLPQTIDTRTLKIPSRRRFHCSSLAMLSPAVNAFHDSSVEELSLTTKTKAKRKRHQSARTRQGFTKMSSRAQSHRHNLLMSKPSVMFDQRESIIPR